jgi:hypothetical protein
MSRRKESNRLKGFRDGTSCPFIIMTPPRCTKQQREKFSAKKDKQAWPHVKRKTIIVDTLTTAL